MENLNIVALTKVYTGTDTDLRNLIEKSFSKKAKTADIVAGLAEQGRVVSKERVNRAMGRFAGKKVRVLISDNKKMLINGIRETLPAAETFNDRELLKLIGESFTVSGATRKVEKALAAK